jgi:hypothetical protein
MSISSISNFPAFCFDQMVIDKYNHPTFTQKPNWGSLFQAVLSPHFESTKFRQLKATNNFNIKKKNMKHET